jgi:hypothetical protein
MSNGKAHPMARSADSRRVEGPSAIPRYAQHCGRDIDMSDVERHGGDLFMRQADQLDRVGGVLVAVGKQVVDLGQRPFSPRGAVPTARSRPMSTAMQS